MSKRGFWVAALVPLGLCAVIVTAACASSPVSVARGREVFAERCAPCHGSGPGTDGSPMLPGTAALDARYKGQVPAQLAKRTDLDAAALTTIVRGGIGAMPSFRKTEVSDDDLKAIAAWIKAGAPEK